MKVRFTKQARKEFFRVVDMFAEVAGQRYADIFIDKVYGIGEQLSCGKDLYMDSGHLGQTKKSYHFTGKIKIKSQNLLRFYFL